MDKATVDLLKRIRDWFFAYNYKYDDRLARDMVRDISDSINIAEGNVFCCETCGADTDEATVCCEQCRMSQDYK
jgi:hypothetical protein